MSEVTACMFRSNWWLAAVASASAFANVNNNGNANANNASVEWCGVRPISGLCPTCMVYPEIEQQERKL